MMNTFLLFVILFCSLSVYAGDQVEILVDGKKHSALTLEEIKKFRSVEQDFFNHVIKRSELYKGVPTLNLIEKVYPETKNIVEVEFKSVNGFTTFVQMDRLQLTSSILAFDRADGDKFVRFSQKEKVLVTLGPLYLVWELKGMNPQERLSYSSVYQIGSINLITNKTEFGIKEDSVDASLYLGHQTYKAHCISCHALGKLGGDVSFDLVKRKTLETKGADYVMKYVLDPRSLNPRTKMLPLPKFKNQAEMAKGIVDFLTFMQKPDEILKQKASTSRGESYKALKELVNSTR